MRKNGKSGGHAGPPLLALVLLVFLVPAPAVAQTEPHPLDTFLTDVLNFTKPTGIRGTVRYIDFDGPVLWLNWHQRSGDPSFEMGWHTVPGEAMLAVHPRDTDSIVDLRALRKGTAVELIIQLDSEGKRRILSFRPMSQLRDVPL